MIYNGSLPALVVNIHEATGGSPAVPFLLMAGTSQSVVATPFGSLCLSPGGPSGAFVVFDGFGAFGGASYQGRPTVGLPGLVNVYLGFTAPVGVAVDFQAVGYNPGLTALGWWATNCDTVSF